MTECNEQSWLFQELGSRKVEADFEGGYLSSDGGGLILREFEHHSGLLRDLAGCFVDYRDQRFIEHSVQELVSQRVYGLILGCCLSPTISRLTNRASASICATWRWSKGFRR